MPSLPDNVNKEQDPPKYTTQPHLSSPIDLSQRGQLSKLQLGHQNESDQTQLTDHRLDKEQTPS